MAGSGACQSLGCVVDSHANAFPHRSVVVKIVEANGVDLDGVVGGVEVPIESLKCFIV